MAKKINDKTIIKEFVKRGKSLRPDGMFMIYNGELCSTVQNGSVDTIGKFKVEFTDDVYKHYITNIFNGPLFDGTKLNAIVSGTKLEILTDDNNKIIGLTSSKGSWEDNFKYSAAEETIIDDMNKINYIMANTNIAKSINLDIEKLNNLKKFTLDLSKDLEVSLFKLTNKMCKNLKSDTKEVKVNVTEQISLDTDYVRVCEIQVIDEISITYSYYAFLDKKA